MSYNTINEKLLGGLPVLLDGGIGTEVMRRGVRWRQHGIEDAPDVIRDIHIDYLNAGVDILTTHTFNLTKRNFINFFRDGEHMTLIGASGLSSKAIRISPKLTSLPIGFVFLNLPDGDVVVVSEPCAAAIDNL